MKVTAKSTLILLLGLCLAINLMAQKKVDMAGTWTGVATLEGEAEPNELVLVLKIEGENLTGHMTGEYGAINEAPVSEIELGDGVFRFSITATGPGGQELMIRFTMNVEDDYMEGTLEVPDMGANGTWEATKKNSGKF